MKFVDHLSSTDKKKLNQVAKKPEKLSPRDLRDLMGENRDTFKRVNGVIKRR
jgi:hypothetical protein